MKHIFICILAFMIAIPAIAQTDGSMSDTAYVQQAQNWLSGLKIAKARFRQTDYQGNVLHGNFYINRPGRLRFEYDAPVKDYIVADGVQIHFYDGTSGQVNSGPIGATLADFILRDGNRFDEKVNVNSVKKRNGLVEISLSQKNQPGMGDLILKFSENPFTLHSWDIIDAQGLTTNIALSNLQRVDRLDPTLFTMRNLNLNE
tara:strand:- start:53 stop:658 length:606 start_codon:yes stop_codon:yes gene_type:complete